MKATITGSGKNIKAFLKEHGLQMKRKGITFEIGKQEEIVEVKEKKKPTKKA